FFPHVGKVKIEGPSSVSGVSDTPSRRKIFICRPAAGLTEDACARRIVSTLARRAFRRPVTPADVGMLMEFYASGRRAGTFDDGVEKALRRLLADPEFVYRHEVAPANVRAGGTYRISDSALASRLSFFVWSSMPDDELLALAGQGKLRQPEVLRGQVERMLTDPRAAALTENFTGQWLNLPAIDATPADPDLYPEYDNVL